MKYLLEIFLHLLLFGLPAVSSTSFSILTSGKAYCRTTELAKNTFIKILFEAPDLVFDGTNPRSGPSYLTIMEKPTLSALDVIEEQEGSRRRHRPVTGAASSPVSHEMKQLQGSFVHHVKSDAELNICIRASSAGSKNPMRFAIRLEEMGDEELAESKLPPAKTVDLHLSFMEQQFERIESQMHAVLKEADFSKERDSIYHTKTDAMHKATVFWPIVHVGILLLTGFTQANHIVQFFKKRRII